MRHVSKISIISIMCPDFVSPTLLRNSSGSLRIIMEPQREAYLHSSLKKTEHVLHMF